MKNGIVAVFVMVMLSATIVVGQEDWTTHTFKTSPEAVFSAAERAIASHHEVKSKDADLHIIRFHVGTTTWSWGYNMILSIEPSPDGSIAKVAIEKSGGSAMSWGSGKKEVGKIFKWTEENLAANRAGK